MLHLANRYTDLRNKITTDVLKEEHNRWLNTLDEHKTDLWKRIEWDGKLNTPPIKDYPSVDAFASHFEDLYKNKDASVAESIMNLQSDVTIPLLDDPISTREVNESINKMKKGGYDYPFSINLILKSMFMPILVILMNMLFYISYPIQCTKSILFAITKKGNLSEPSNFRGIQMMSVIACLCDKILAARLQLWITVSDEQTAYQKGKSVLNNIFTLRLLIELAKVCDVTLYIGFFDIAKAFDHVSRYLLLKKLVDMGIGKCMLKALQMMYNFTHCIVAIKGTYSDEFQTLSGIRQGATSSSILFISFMDDLIQHLKAKCDPANLIGDLHSLLHADDTVLINTNKETFIHKCKVMQKFFKEKQLSLNIKKSRYMIVNGNLGDVKSKLDIGSGFLSYTSTYTYLGYTITRSGKLKDDFDNNINEKRSNLTIKFLNFCRSNFMAPLNIKLEVLNLCLKSTLLFGCEIWGNVKLDRLETCYRKAIKYALSARPSVNNEIVYIESGQYPLVCDITSRQLKFWLRIQDSVSVQPNNYTSRLLVLAIDKNIPYILYYKNLEDMYITSVSCNESLKEKYRTIWTRTINSKHTEDTESKRGVYKSINPNLKCYIPNALPEYERMQITRYRIGSHNLLIEKGRHSRMPRENRVCICDTGIQSLHHVIFSCPLTKRLPEVSHILMNFSP